MGSLLFGQFAAALGEGSELLPAVESGLFVLPVLAKFGEGLAGETLFLLGLKVFQGCFGGGFCRLCAVDRKMLLSDLAGMLGLRLFEFLLRLLQAGEVAAEFVALLELLVPDGEAFAELGALRMLGAEIIDLLDFTPGLRLGLQALRRDLGAMLTGGDVLRQMFGLQPFLFSLQGFEFGFGLLAGGAGVLPLLV